MSRSLKIVALLSLIVVGIVALRSTATPNAETTSTADPVCCCGTECACETCDCDGESCTTCQCVGANGDGCDCSACACDGQCGSEACCEAKTCCDSGDCCQSATCCESGQCSKKDAA